MSNIIISMRDLYNLPNVEEQLIKWIKQVELGLLPKNICLEKDGFNVYVRKSSRALLGYDNRKIMIDLAKIDIPEDCRGKGWFKNFLKIVELNNPWDGIYFESILNMDLYAHLQKAGCLKDHDDNLYLLKS